MFKQYFHVQANKLKNEYVDQANTASLNLLNKGKNTLAITKKVFAMMFLMSMSNYVPSVAANPLNLNQADLAFCSQSVANYAKAVRSSSSSSSSGYGGVGYGIVGVNAGYSDSSSSRYKENIESQFRSRNCDALLNASSRVTIAQIKANADVAIAQLNAESQQYDSDTQRLIASLQLQGVVNTNQTNLAGIVDTNATNVQVAGINANASTTNTLIGAIGGIIQTSIVASAQNNQPTQQQSPPPVSDPPVTDSRVAMIQSWGFTLAKCSSSTARISIDGQKALCVLPVNGIKSGQRYSHNSETGTFKRIPSTTISDTVKVPTPTPSVRTNNGGNGF